MSNLPVILKALMAFAVSVLIGLTVVGIIFGVAYCAVYYPYVSMAGTALAMVALLAVGVYQIMFPKKYDG